MAVAIPRRVLAAAVSAVLTIAVPRIAAQTFEVASIKPSRMPNGRSWSTCWRAKWDAGSWTEPG